jgi:Coenzyme PQQ synthesis protein D (PqqD)
MKTAKTRLFSRFWHRFCGFFEPTTSSAGLDCRGSGARKRHLSAAPGTHVSARNDGLAILQIQSGRVFVCNATGARIWQGVSKGLGADAISREISLAHHVPPETADRDTALFIGELERNGLVTRS